MGDPTRTVSEKKNLSAKEVVEQVKKEKLKRGVESRR